MAPRRVPLRLILAALVLVAARDLAAADGGSEHRRLGMVVVERDAAAAGRWSATVRRGGGGHGGHGHGHGHGRGRGRGHETPSVFYPRTVTGGGNHRHGRSAAARTTTTTGPGRPAARAMLIVSAAVLLLLRRL